MPEPVWTAYGVLSTYDNRKNKNLVFTIGDDISFNDQWSALIGVTHARIGFDAYTVDSGKISSYEKDDITPTVSLIYQPRPWLTTYMSYMEALEQGGTAGDTFGAYTVANGGDVLEPLVSEQIEIGAKASIGGMLLTAALFEIDKPLEYYSIISGTEAEFVQDGRQVHKGLEFTATGKLTENLRLVSGATFLNAEVRDNQQNPTLEGKTPSNVAEKFYKVYLDYDIPHLPGLSLNGGAVFTGDFYGDSENTDKIDGYTLIDIGARYRMEVANTPLTLRFNINNLTDERYWANNSFLGDTRTISFSANIQF
jgi:iron complex outermembrane receptor protein